MTLTQRLDYAELLLASERVRYEQEIRIQRDSALISQLVNQVKVQNLEALLITEIGRLTEGIGALVGMIEDDDGRPGLATAIRRLCESTDPDRTK